MQLASHKKFEKQIAKAPVKVQRRFRERVALLVENPQHPSLRVHALKGDKIPMQNMNVTGDYRALFIATKTKITFYEIGTHSELYE